MLLTQTKGNQLSLELDWTSALHKRENNAESEANLKAHKYHFTGQVAYIMTLLQKGVVLTRRSAMIDHNISDLPSRIRDLRGAHLERGLDPSWIADRWVKPAGEKAFKEWFAKL